MCKEILVVPPQEDSKFDSFAVVDLDVKHVVDLVILQLKKLQLFQSVSIQLDHFSAYDSLICNEI